MAYSVLNIFLVFFKVKKIRRRTYLQNRNRLTDIENRFVVARVKGRKWDGLGVRG